MMTYYMIPLLMNTFEHVNVNDDHTYEQVVECRVMEIDAQYVEHPTFELMHIEDVHEKGCEHELDPLPFRRKRTTSEDNAYACDKVVENVKVEIGDQLPISSTFEPMIVENERVLEKEINHVLEVERLKLT